MTEEVFDGLEEGERVLFGDKKVPLEVSEVGEERVFVEGPHGGEYVLFRSPDDGTLLHATRGNRRYASLLEDLRTVGRWEQLDEDTWEHTVSDAVVRLMQNDAGFWTIETEGLDVDLDLPAYGFTDREAAEDAVEKLIGDNPEG
jgi:hypothetical protein